MLAAFAFFLLQSDTLNHYSGLKLTATLWHLNIIIYNSVEKHCIVFTIKYQISK